MRGNTQDSAAPAVTAEAGRELVTQAEHARRCNVSRKSVTAWKQAGRLVLVGELVDFEQSYKGESWHAGSKKARQEMDSSQQRAAGASPAPVPRRATRPQSAEQPATLTAGEIHQRLKALDYTADPDWSAAAQVARVHEAARCVGLVALQSDLRDDGHHGGFQLRHGEPGSTIDGDILAGYGFELEPWQAILECRQWATGVNTWDGRQLFDPEEPARVVLNLLPCLALPVLQLEAPRPRATAGCDPAPRLHYGLIAWAAGRP